MFPCYNIYVTVLRAFSITEYVSISRNIILPFIQHNAQRSCSNISDFKTVHYGNICNFIECKTYNLVFLLKFLQLCTGRFLDCHSTTCRAHSKENIQSRKKYCFQIRCPLSSAFELAGAYVIIKSSTIISRVSPQQIVSFLQTSPYAQIEPCYVVC